jgi:hypothetical protein
MKGQCKMERENHIYKSNNCGDFIILDKYVINKKTKCTIRFILTGTELKNVSFDAIKKGRVKDRFFPNICNVAFIGNIEKSKYEELYRRWYAMIRRCYDNKCDSYKNYGQKGIYVDNRWLCFKNYVYDILEMLKNMGLSYETFINGFYHIDKDIKYENNSVYSKHTCIIINGVINSIEPHLLNIKLVRLNDKKEYDFHTQYEASEFLGWEKSYIKTRKSRKKKIFDINNNEYQIINC